MKSDCNVSTFQNDHGFNENISFELNQKCHQFFISPVISKVLHNIKIKLLLSVVAGFHRKSQIFEVYFVKTLEVQ